MFPRNFAFRLIIGTVISSVVLPLAFFAQTAEDLGVVIKAVKSSAKRNLDRRPNTDPNTKNIRKFEVVETGFKVKLVIENSGKEPVIIFNPNISIGTGLTEVRICFEGTEYRAGFGSERFENCSPVVIERTQDQQDAFRMMADQFDVPKPPENLTIILEPGESFPFNEDVRIDLKEMTPKPFSKMVSYIDPNGRKREYEDHSKYYDGTTVSLTYEFSLVPYVEDPDILEKMAIRWRRFGRLPVSQNGTYKLITEKIPL